MQLWIITHDDQALPARALTASAGEANRMDSNSFDLDHAASNYDRNYHSKIIASYNYMNRKIQFMFSLLCRHAHNRCEHHLTFIHGLLHSHCYCNKFLFFIRHNFASNSCVFNVHTQCVTVYAHTTHIRNIVVRNTSSLRQLESSWSKSMLRTAPHCMSELKLILNNFVASMKRTQWMSENTAANRVCVRG